MSHGSALVATSPMFTRIRLFSREYLSPGAAVLAAGNDIFLI
jgi:hypothetical protein